MADVAAGRGRAAAATGSLVGLGALLFAAGCATTDVEPLREGVDPQALTGDERFIWAESLEVQDALNRSGLLYQDAPLDGYLAEVTDRVVGDDFRAAGVVPRVHVLSDVDMNAFAFANGVVYLHTAVLARMQNEAQLGTLLAHEFSHSIHRHTLRQHRDIKNKTAWLAGLAPVAAGLPLGPLLLQVGTVSSMLGYSRELEREADEEGFELLVRADYRSSEAPGLFEEMIAYQRELEAQGIDRPKIPYFFSTHPRMQERIDDFRELIERRPAESTQGVVNGSVYRRHTRAVRLHQAELELAAGRSHSAQITVERVLDDFPDDATAWSLKGLALASGGEHGDARACFRTALELDASLPAAHRALGMGFYREWRTSSTGAAAETAMRHLQRYLELRPDATDRGYVSSYIGELEGAAAPEARSGSGEAGAAKEASP